MHAVSPTSSGSCLQVAYSPNNEVLATGGYDQAVKVWDTRSRAHQALQVMRPFADSVTSVTITAE
jgi:WD40 repeat protein